MIFYLSFYTGLEVKDSHELNGASSSKIDFIADELLKKDDVTIVSFCKPSISKKIRKNTYILKTNGRHNLYVRYVFKRNFKNKILRFIYDKIVKFSNLFTLYLNIRKKTNNFLVIYHSLYFLFFEKKISNNLKHKAIIEIEEIYSVAFCDVIPKFSKYKEKEIRVLNNFKNSIFITRELNEIIKIDNYIVCNGILKPETFIFDKKTNDVSLVYAGGIEKIYSAAFNAVELMMYLPSNFRLYICGNGPKEVVQSLKEKIQRINKLKGNENIEFLGLLSNPELNELFKKCDIGLCIENDVVSLERQKYSFHSKILKYLSYSLLVFSSKHIAEMNSCVSDLVVFVSGNNFHEISNLIEKYSNVSKSFIFSRMKTEFDNFSKGFSLFLQKCNF